MGSLHCLDVGCADATVIQAPGATFLVDCCNIDHYSHLLPTGKVIHGVFITHQHSDHYSGLKYLKEHGYTVDYLIYSPYDRRYGDTSVTLDEWNEFNSLRTHFATKGTKLYAPYRQDSWDKPWWYTNGLKFWIIGPSSAVAQSASREIHDASLVIAARMGSRMCCFAGDASDANLDNIAANTSHYCNDILHASHHGSLNGASLAFIKKAEAKYTVISTKSGVYENVPHPTALQRYAAYTPDHVYRTDSGTVKWSF